MIKPNIDDSELLSQSACTLERRFQVELERAAVRQLGQRIVMRQICNLRLSFDPVAFGNRLQLQFRRPASADVFHDAHEQFDRFIGCSDAPNGQMRPDQVAIFPDVTLFQVIGVDLAIQDSSDLCEIGRKILRAGEGLEGQAFQLIGGIAQKLTQLVIDLQPGAIRF